MPPVVVLRGDYAATELAHRDRAALLAALGPDGEDLLRSIANFDYQAALTALDVALRRD